MNTATAQPTLSPLHLDRHALHAWLAARLPELPAQASALQLTRLTGGQSNPSWWIQASAEPGAPAWVLRAKPGPAATLLASAHAIEREYQVMGALYGTPVPVPRMQLFCEDESVIGAAFFLMDYVPGRILREATLPGMPPAERGALYGEANRVLAELHQVDWAARGLSGFGRSEGFFERLIARWGKQYRASLTAGPIAAMEQLMAWLPEHIPAGSSAAQTTLTHGDFRLENLIFHPEEPRVLAVLDWELATLGQPLSDLAYHCMAWHLPGGGMLRGFAGEDLGALGLPSQREHIRRYLERCGRSAELERVLADWPFYLACNFFRLAAILQGIAKRIEQGSASSPQALEVARMAEPVAQWGWEIASGQRPAL